MSEAATAKTEGKPPQPAAAYQQPAASSPAYAPTPPPPGQYQNYAPYPDQPLPASGGLGRWFFIGCGCLIVACIVLSIVAALVIDSDERLRCGLPVVRQIYTTINPASCPPQ